jgi:hypothetical protein
VAIDEADQVHVVWSDFIDYSAQSNGLPLDRLDLFSRKGIPDSNSGITWSPIERVTCSKTNKQNPSIATVGQAPVFLWWQLRDGFQNLFFKGP